MSKKKSSTSSFDGALVLLCVIPVVLSSFKLFQSNYLVDSLIVTLNYILLLIGFIIFTVLLFNKVQSDHWWFEIFRTVMVVTVFWDFGWLFTGFQNQISLTYWAGARFTFQSGNTFYLLKALLYVLILIRYPGAFFPKSGFNFLIKGISSYTVLGLALVLKLFINASSVRISGSGNRSFIFSIIDPDFIYLIILIMMAFLSVAFSIPQLKKVIDPKIIQKRLLSLVVFESLILLLALIQLASYLRFIYYYQIVLFGLYVYLLILSCGEKVETHYGIVALVPITFTVFYIGGYFSPILSTLVSLGDFVKTLDIWWQIFGGIATIVGFVTSIMQLLEKKP